MVIQEALTWTQAARAPRLREGEVHVWRISLPGWRSRIAGLACLLSPDEATRARRFKFEADRQRYIVARGNLRILLGEYLRRAPESIAIGFHEGGKPFVEQPRAKRTVCFNLSHAADEILCAVALDREVGVDIERIDRHTDHLALARRFFSPRELESLRSLDGPGLARRFFACWTRKEAFTKAIGAGLGMPLQSFTIPTAPDAAFSLTTGSGELWSFHAPPEIPGHASCLVTRGDNATNLFFERVGCPTG